MLDIDCKFNGITGWLRSQIILTSLKTILPAIEVHGGHLSEVWLSHVDVGALGLADVGSSTDGEIKKNLLWDFPYSLVKILDILRYTLNVLDTTIKS